MGLALWLIGIAAGAVIISRATTRRSLPVRIAVAVIGFIVLSRVTIGLIADGPFGGLLVADRAPDDNGDSYTVWGFVAPLALFFPGLFAASVVAEHRILVRALSQPLTASAVDDPRLAPVVRQLTDLGFEFLGGGMFDVAGAMTAVLVHPDGTRVEIAVGPSKSTDVRCEVVTEFVDGTRVVSSNQAVGPDRRACRLPGRRPAELLAAHRLQLSQSAPTGAAVRTDISFDRWHQDAIAEIEGLLERPWRVAWRIVAQLLPIPGLRAWALRST